LKSSISIGENCNYFFHICIIWGGGQFSPILILLFKLSRKFEGVRKFILEKLSYLEFLAKKLQDFAYKFSFLNFKKTNKKSVNFSNKIRAKQTAKEVTLPRKTKKKQIPTYISYCNFVDFETKHKKSIL
jgi:hypothetical protein